MGGVKEEFARLEDNLKRMLSDLQENYRRDADERAAENMRQMTNNMALIREITRQRESNRRLRSQVDRMEMQLKERARDNKGRTRLSLLGNTPGRKNYKDLSIITRRRSRRRAILC